MDRRVQKTKEAIRASYFQLLQGKPDGRITVSELTRQANMDRKTFYLHYTCVEDILNDFCDEKVDLLLCRLKDTGYLENPLLLKILFKVLNEILEEDIDYFRLLSLRNYQSFWDKIHTLMVQTLLNAYSDKVSVSRDVMETYCDFFIAGMIRIYQDYLNESKDLSSEQLEKVILDIALNGVMHLIRA